MADISPGDTVFITFQAQILAIPPSGTLTNNALVNYEYTVNPNQSPAVGSTVTNTTVTPIIDATLVINKSASTTLLQLVIQLHSLQLLQTTEILLRTTLFLLIQFQTVLPLSQIALR